MTVGELMQLLKNFDSSDEVSFMYYGDSDDDVEFTCESIYSIYNVKDKNVIIELLYK